MTNDVDTILDTLDEQRISVQEGVPPHDPLKGWLHIETDTTEIVMAVERPCLDQDQTEMMYRRLKGLA